MDQQWAVGEWMVVNRTISLVLTWKGERIFASASSSRAASKDLASLSRSDSSCPSHKTVYTASLHRPRYHDEHGRLHTWEMRKIEARTG